MADDVGVQNIRRTDSGYRYELSGLRSACADAMIFIGQSRSIDEYNAAINSAVASVDAMEDHLAPYWDNELTNDKDGKIIKGSKERDATGYESMIIPTLEDFKKSHPEIELDKVDRAYDEMRLDTLRKQLRKKIQALIRLQDRKNLLLEEETEDHAG